ncbi:MAG TPA: pepsin/retropepsin-like aspartic protease family protein [Gammaproteobacteria bacterium]|nr:pepsin/retropepsin-like aspartic protease family protein [Gammaproteobacteria bacterium]
MIRLSPACLVMAALGSCLPLRAEVPLTIAESGHAVVPVELEGLGVFAFVLDTGAEGSALYSPFEAVNHVPMRAETTELQGQTGAAPVRVASLPPVSVDGLRAEHVAAVVLEPRADGVPLPGIIGLDVFGGAVLDFDLPRGRAKFGPSGTRFASTDDAVAAATTTGGLLTFPVEIAGVEAVAVLDTGARKTRINWRLGRLLGLDAAKLAPGDVIQGATNSAVVTSEATVQDVRFGAAKLRSAPVLVADLPVFEVFGVADRPAVIFGLDWLTETRLVVDFPLRRIWFSQDGR